MFGDEAKGVVVDNLCDPTSLVVRFSGGQQCGHTVMRDGIKHTFSSFGAGTLQGAGTYFTEHTTLFPKTFLKEYDVLVSKGITPPKVGVHPLTRITTIYDVAYNRASEKVNRNGSCGLGVGATMKRNDETHYNLYACDLENEFVYNHKMGAINCYYDGLVSKQSKEFFSEYWDQLDELYQDCDVREKERQDFLSKIRVVLFENYYMRFSNIVFEGSQGIQLDMHHGIFPNVTYANTTSKNAIEYLKKYDLEADVFYVTRCYGTRHGEGPIPNCEIVDLINNEEEINVFNAYQQEFKVFEFDMRIVEHAIRVDGIYHEDRVQNKNLVITCLDQRPGWRIPEYHVSLNGIYLNDSPKCGNMFLS